MNYLGKYCLKAAEGEQERERVRESERLLVHLAGSAHHKLSVPFTGNQFCNHGWKILHYYTKWLFLHFDTLLEYYLNICTWLHFQGKKYHFLLFLFLIRPLNREGLFFSHPANDCMLYTVYQSNIMVWFSIQFHQRRKNYQELRQMTMTMLLMLHNVVSAIAIYMCLNIYKPLVCSV